MNTMLWLKILKKYEHWLFGEDGFEKMVQRVANLEKAIGINDLAQFTPH
jgi:hypothetical protein